MHRLASRTSIDVEFIGVSCGVSSILGGLLFDCCGTSLSTASCMKSGDRCEYRTVIAMLLWPRASWIARTLGVRTRDRGGHDEMSKLYRASRHRTDTAIDLSPPGWRFSSPPPMPKSCQGNPVVALQRPARVEELRLLQRASVAFDDAGVDAAFVSSHVRSTTTRSERASRRQSLAQHLRSDSAASEGRHGVVADVAAFEATCIVQLVANGDTPHELFFPQRPEMRLGNDRFGSPIRVCQPLCYERGEVLFGALEVGAGPPGKAFVSEFTKPAQEALSTSLRRRNQLDLHSRIHACPFRRPSRLAKTARRRFVPPSAQERGK